MDAPVIAAFVASGTAITASVANSIITIYLARRSEALKHKEYKIQFLNRKIEYLDKAKKSLLDTSREAKNNAFSEESSGIFNREYIYAKVMERFYDVSPIFLSIRHYISRSRVNELNELHICIIETIAVQKLMLEGEDLNEQVLESKKVISLQEMVFEIDRFNNFVVSAVDEELDEAIYKVDNLV
jgi:hypothetical protein